MKLGKLNDFLEDISFSYHFTGTPTVPATEISGDPVKGELLQLRWAAIRDMELSLDITLPREAFVDTVVLDFGPKTTFR